MTGQIIAGTWTRVSKAAALDRRLSAAAFRVLGVLGCYADETGRSYPSVSTIAAKLGLQDRIVQVHLRALEKLGYLTTRRQIRPYGVPGQRKNGARLGGQTSNAYQLTFPDVPSLARLTTDAVQPECNPSNATGCTPNAPGGCTPNAP